MYAALYVVEDLDGYLANPDAYLASHPLEIKDPLLADRRPRTEWKFDDLAEAMSHLGSATEGGSRSYGTGRQMFQTGACIACHKLDDVGNAFGPDLTKLDPKWGPTEILKELLDPSARINEKFQTYAFVLDSGKVDHRPDHRRQARHADGGRESAGEVAAGDDQEVGDRRTAKASDVDHAEGSLDKLTRDEIMDLVAFLTSRGDKNHAVFKGGHAHGH